MKQFYALSFVKKQKQNTRRILLFWVLVLVAAVPPLNLFAQVPNQTVANGAATAPVTFPSTGCIYNWVNNTPGIGLAASGTGNIASFTAVNAGTSPVTAAITATPVGSPGYAYISNQKSNNISVINISTNTVAATLPMKFDASVSVSPDGKLAYATGNVPGHISIINTLTNEFVNRISVNSGLFFVLPSPDGTKLYVAAGSGVIVLNSVTGSLFPQSFASNAAEQIALTPDGSKLYVPNITTNNIFVYNTTTGALIATIPAPAQPISVTVSPDGTKAYAPIIGAHEIMVINTATNAVISIIQVGLNPFEVVNNADGSRIYCVNAASNSIAIINTATNTVIDTLLTDSGPQGMSFTPDGSRYYVPCYNTNNVLVYNTATNALITRIPVGQGPVNQGNFIAPASNCTGSPVTFTITVNPGGIITSTATGYIAACAGTPSSGTGIQQFTVSGAALSAGITATAPANFEVSLAPGSGYASSVTLSETAGVVDSTVVYVRSAATAPAGNISGNVVLTSAGVTSQNVAVSGTVNALLTVNPVANQTVFKGNETAAINFTGTGILYNWTNDQPGIGLPASGSGNIAPFTAINTGSSPVTAKITVTPEMVPLRAYIANYVSNTVSVIDIATQTVIATIPVQQGPESVTVTSDGQRVYVGNHIAQSISVINTNTNTVISTIYLGILPYQVVVSPDGNRLYVTNDSDDRIWVISTATNAVVARIPVGSIQEGIAISADGSRVYTSTGSVINTTSNTVVSTIPVGNYPICVAVSPDGSRVYVTNSIGGNLSVINTSTNRVIATIPVGAYPVGVSVSPDGTKVYVANRDSNSVSVINTATNTVRTTIPAIRAPIATSVTPNGSLLYVTNLYGIVTAINTSTNAVVATIPVGTYNNEIGNFISGSSGCSGAPVTFTITAKPINASLASMQVSSYHLSPYFSPAITNYNDTVSYDHPSITITPVAKDSLATITVNGTAVASGNTSLPLALNEGANTITIVVTAEDGITTETYTLKVVRGPSSNAALSQLHPTAGYMTQYFTPVISSYVDNVTYQNTSVSFTPIAQDSLATITINGVAVASGTLSQVIPLNEDSNTVTTIVTAPDGVTTKMYTVNVIRAGSSNASLGEMHPDAGYLNQIFSPTITSYTDTVNNTNIEVSITPVAQDPLATITVNGTAVTSGSASPVISLQVGNTVISTVVTAPDGVTTQTYTLTMTRKGPTPGAADAAFRPQGFETSASGLQQADDDGVLVHQAVSPNGDGINDFLQIDNIAKYPENKLVIMNNNGQQVFEAKGYDNSSKVFDGHSNKNGQMQLPGTYFYQLDYTVAGIVKHKTGFLVLKY